MAKIVIPKGTKEPVRLRLKNLANGNKSFYLDIYANGKRYYEFLQLYLIPERTLIDKEQNRQTASIANQIKAQRIIDLANGKVGKPNSGKSKMLFIDFLATYYDEEVKDKKAWSRQYRNAIDIIKTFAETGLRLKDVDKEWCKEFINYLLYTYRTKQGDKLKSNTIPNYTIVLGQALEWAVEKEYIQSNPYRELKKGVRPTKVKDSPVCYLTEEELKKLEATECRNPYVKQAYLFSCFCGLRISDVQRLRWADVENTAQGLRLAITQKKTKKPLYLPLNDKAAQLLPERGENDGSELVFDKLPNISNIDKILKKWATSVGIDKKVTFHTARHTFATLLHSKGADIYTISSLLGHKDVTTTQKYAKIADEKKASAANLLNNL